MRGAVGEWRGGVDGGVEEVRGARDTSVAGNDARRDARVPRGAPSAARRLRRASPRVADSVLCVMAARRVRVHWNPSRLLLLPAAEHSERHRVERVARSGRTYPVCRAAPRRVL